MLHNTAKMNNKKEDAIFGVIKNPKIFDIFKSKRIQKNSSNTNPLPPPQIIVDTREKNSLVVSELISMNGAQIDFKILEIGDYLIGDIIIERKTFQDFISSMISKRLVEQLIQMRKYEKRLLILEGKNFESLEENKTKLNPNAIRGMLLAISLEFNTPLIFTNDSEETAKYLLLLAKRQLKAKVDFSFHSRKPESKKQKLQYIIESFPNIGPKNAKMLLKHFKTIKKIITSNPVELEKIIGKSKAESFKLIDDEF